jgi:electron transport complex protein RnfE
MNGITTTNPIFILFLGLCPFLAISTSVDNAMGMSAAVLFVLLGSNITISLVRKVIPDMVRIPVFIVIIATLVTLVFLLFQAYSPALSKALGIYVPLIVVNCIILGRAEAFASKKPVKDSVLDALGMGIGFSVAILLISVIREILGTGELSVFGTQLLSIPGLSSEPISMFILPTGAFLVIGLLVGFFRYIGVMPVE